MGVKEFFKKGFSDMKERTAAANARCDVAKKSN